MNLDTAIYKPVSDVTESSVQCLRAENEELRRYLDAQKKVLASLERRVGRSLESLGVRLEHLSGTVNDASDWQANLGFVQDEVSALCDLLSDAMLLQKFEAGKVEVELAPLPVETVLNAVTRHLLTANDSSPVRLICELEQPLPIVLGDQEMLEAVLTDLLARSLRYSDVDFPVILGVQAIANEVQICITAQRFAPVGNRDFATEIVLCCRRIEVQKGKVTCQAGPDGLQTVTVALQRAV